VDKIISLGGVATRIARKFEKYPEYSILKIDTEDSKEKNYLRIEVRSSPEEYENDPPKFKNFLKNVKGEILFVVSGASICSGASLLILEYLHKKCDINILYVQPDVSLSSNTKRLQERTVFNVLQQYSRSGLFKKMYLVSNEELDPLVQDASILNYYDSLNEVIASSFHMINVFDHSDSVTDTFSDPLEVSRICTIGLFNPEDDSEKSFFPLDITREIRYYYGIPEEKLEKEVTLHRKIVDQMRTRAQQNENRKVSYGIFSTNYDYICGYALYYSSAIQGDTQKNS